MIAIADGGVLPFLSSTVLPSNYRSQVQADRLRQTGGQTGGLKSGRLSDDESLGKDVCS